VKWRLSVVRRADSCKGAAVQRGLEHGRRRIAIVRSCYYEMSSEDTAGWNRLNVCCSDTKILQISYGAIIKYNFKLCVQVVYKSNIQSKTPSIIALCRLQYLNIGVTCR
jgi:hypothetical protein